LPAEGQIEDDLLALDVLADIAAGEARDGRRPFGRVGGGAADVGGDGAAGEEVDTDDGAVVLGGVDAAVVRVEAGAVGRRVRAGDLAAGVVRLVRVVDPAVGRDEVAGEAAVSVDLAALGSVQGHVVGALLVDPLDDV